MRASKLLLVAMATVAVACSTEQNSDEKDIAKIGSRISRETADAMIGNVAGRQREPEAYIYGKAMLQEILSVQGAEGIFIFNSLDNAGKTRLIFRPADATGDVVANNYAYDDGLPCPPTCPKENISSIGKIIEGAQAEEWIKSFQSANSNSAHSFLFGKDIFNQLLAQTGIAGIAFINGTKASGQDALVLVGVTENGTMLWNSLIFDDSKVCPPDCPLPPPRGSGGGGWRKGG